MCGYAKNLYNVGLYSIHQYFLAEGRYLRYESNYQVVKENENYALLEESYTSQVSFLDGDAIPVWNGRHQEVTGNGKRVKRGLNRTKDRLAMNADVNGAAAILGKSNLRLIRNERVARGLLANPLRVKLTSIGSSQESPRL
jgi:hypothetical protein